jgi:hypothetical protein
MSKIEKLYNKIHKTLIKKLKNGYIVNLDNVEHFCIDNDSLEAIIQFSVNSTFKYLNEIENKKEN